jgi:hypothetical protein
MMQRAATLFSKQYGDYRLSVPLSEGLQMPVKDKF